MRLNKLLILGMVLMLSGAGLSAQSPKFGHIDVESVLLEMPEYKNIQTVLEAETGKLEEQFTTMREELGKLETDYQQNGAALTDAERQTKESELMTMQQKVQAFYTNAQQSLQQKNQELQMPVWDKLIKAIETVGSEGGFLYIFEVKSGLTLYQSAQSVDIAPLVKAKLGIN
jgi:outer membrane protein